MNLPKDDKTLLLVLLIIQSILILFRTMSYVIFDKHLLNLDEVISGKDYEKTVDLVLTMFAVIRIVISTIVISKRGFNNDILTYALVYLIFSSFLRFYYQYLIQSKSNPKIKYYIDKYQDTNAIILLFISAYIIKFIFF